MNKKLILSSLGTFIAGILLGGALLYNDDVYLAVNKAVAGENLQNNVGAAYVNGLNLQGLSLEEALQLVQGQRTALLETQLQDQIAQVQAKNQQVASLNAVLIELNRVVGSLSAASSPVSAADQSTLQKLYSAAGLSKDSIPNNKTKVVSEITSVKGKIDSLSNSQQMDMLRLQSMSNKRNEAFDVMTNFIKKMQESRSSIIGNMR